MLELNQARPSSGDQLLPYGTMCKPQPAKQSKYRPHFKKKEEVESISDFRPISLIHAFAKIISKILALRLAPKMQELIATCQSAFIKGRSIHDNFLYVRNLAQRFHRSGMPSLLFKLDISKAFDSVCWDYLLSLMQHRGFPHRWINWIAAILSTSTSTILVNGTPTEHIHGRGLR